MPPPQQKFLPFSLSIVTIGAFQAASNTVARLLRFGINQHPVHIEDNGLRSRHRLYPARSFSEKVFAVTCLPKIGTHARRAARNQNALCKPIPLDKKPMAAGPVSMPA